ncbi:hypothetical protein ABPG74_016106 [Tetrahymena malaccensis]
MSALKALLAVSLIASVLMFIGPYKTNLKESKKIALNHQDGSSNLLVKEAYYSDNFPLYGACFATFSSTDPYIYIPSIIYDFLLYRLNVDGVDYRTSPIHDYQLRVKKIKKLSDVNITLLTEGNQPYTITIKPSQYTRYIKEDGEYEVLIVPSEYTNTYSISTQALSSYNIEFDPETDTTYIQEKKKN